MSAECNKVRRIGANVFVDGANVAGDIDASATLIWVMKRMIVEERMERVRKKQISSFLEAATLRFGQLFVAFLESSM